MSRIDLNENILHLPIYLRNIDFKTNNIIFYKKFGFNLLALKIVYNLEHSYFKKKYNENIIISNKFLFNIYIEKNNKIVKINLSKIIVLMFLDLIKYPITKQNSCIPNYNYNLSNLFIESLRYKLNSCL